MIKSLFMRDVFEPLYSKYYRKDNRIDHYRFLKKVQHNPMAENLKIQKKLLYNMLKYAIENIPYYKNLGIKVSEKNILRDLKRFPILDKEIIKKNFKDLHKINKGVKWYYNTSGGSTGKPVKFVQDFNYESCSAAMNRVQEEWAYYALGDKQVRLWGSEKDIFQEKEKFKHRFANWMRNVVFLNSFLMDKNLMHGYIKVINSYKPVMILSYAQSIYELSKFIKKNKLKVYSPKSIMTSAGVLYPEMRTMIESVFRCPVYNRYGSREVGAIACECEKHEGLHLSMFNHYVEILKDGKACKEGETGEIFITTLTNQVMPLIRYRIGDMAIPTKKKCSCGRGLPMIKHIVGRDVDMFINTQGKLIDGEYFTHLFYFKDHIERFQVIQKSKSHILIKVVSKEREAFEKEFPEIKKKIELVMGKCKIEYKLVKKIPPLKSGKFRYTIREFEYE